MGNTLNFQMFILNFKVYKMNNKTLISEVTSNLIF